VVLVLGHEPDLPVFVAAGVFDLLIVTLMIWVARQAHARLDPVAGQSVGR
jgi:hypothetical protein